MGTAIDISHLRSIKDRFSFEGKKGFVTGAAGGIGRNAKELLRLVQAAKFVREHGDQVCPAKWQPGAETLKPSLDLVGQLSGTPRGEGPEPRGPPPAGGPL